MMKTLTEKKFDEWHEDEISVTLRANGATCGGGGEVLLICSRSLQPHDNRRHDDDAVLRKIRPSPHPMYCDEE